MWAHPSEADLVDLLDGAASSRVGAHVEACARCRARVDEARTALLWAERASAPEPSPLYWEAMRRRVADGVAAPGRSAARRPLLAAAALAGAALLAVVAVRPGWGPSPSSPASPVAALPAWSALPPADEDPSLPALEHVVPAALAEAPSVVCSGVAECIADLDDEEVRALADALRHELGTS